MLGEQTVLCWGTANVGISSYLLTSLYTQPSPPPNHHFVTRLGWPGLLVSFPDFHQFPEDFICKTILIITIPSVVGSNTS